MDSSHPICRACGVQFETDHDVANCPICDDERQYVPAEGQQWTTMVELRDAGYRTVLRQEPHGLWGLGTEPRFAIG